MPLVFVIVVALTTVNGLDSISPSSFDKDIYGKQHDSSPLYKWCLNAEDDDPALSHLWYDRFRQANGCLDDGVYFSNIFQADFNLTEKHTWVDGRV